MKRIFALLIASVLAACGGEDGASIVVSDHVDQADVAMVEKAAGLLVERCSALNKGWADVEEANAEIEGDYWAKNTGAAASHGWGRTVLVTIKIKENPAAIPAGWRAGGHTLRFHLGGGQRPGVAVVKRPARFLCGTADPDEDRNVIRVIKDFAFIK